MHGIDKRVRTVKICPPVLSPFYANSPHIYLQIDDAVFEHNNQQMFRLIRYELVHDRLKGRVNCDSSEDNTIFVVLLVE